jgi:hypothetical protein
VAHLLKPIATTLGRVPGGAWDRFLAEAWAEALDGAIGERAWS